MARRTVRIIIETERVTLVHTFPAAPPDPKERPAQEDPWAEMAPDALPPWKAKPES